MTRQIIQQPDGKYAIWSSIVDSFTDIDCTPEEIIDILAQEEAEHIRKRVYEVVESLVAGNKPYYQFTLTWEQALRKHKRVHGSAFDLEAVRNQEELGL